MSSHAPRGQGRKARGETFSNETANRRARVAALPSRAARPSWMSNRSELPTEPPGGRRRNESRTRDEG